MDDDIPSVLKDCIPWYDKADLFGPSSRAKY